MCVCMCVNFLLLFYLYSELIFLFKTVSFVLFLDNWYFLGLLLSWICLKIENETAEQERKWHERKSKIEWLSKMVKERVVMRMILQFSSKWETSTVKIDSWLHHKKTKKNIPLLNYQLRKHVTVKVLSMSDDLK